MAGSGPKFLRALAALVVALTAPRCKPSDEAPASRASDLETESQALPVLLAEGDSGSQIFLYATHGGSSPKVRICTSGSLEQCQSDSAQPNLTPIQVANGRTFFASRSLAATEDSVIHLVAFGSSGAVEASRSLRFMRAGGALALVSPKERQVFQREAIDKGKIRIQLPSSTGQDVRYLRARVTGTALSNSVKAKGTWHEVDLRSNGTATASMTIAAPAGGWFNVEVMALDDSKTRLLGRTSVKEVGVGEVFLVAGQSNSTNCGRAPQRSDSDFVVSTDGETWQRGDDPQIGTHDDHLCNNLNGSTYGGSNWPVTGSLLAKKYRVPVAFASTGYSGSALAEWLPTVTTPPARDNKNQTLFDYTAKRAEQLSIGGLRAVLWHQGENDAKDNTTRATYEAGLTAVIRGLRERSKVETPWLIAVASWCAPGAYGPEWKGGSAEVTAAQEGLVAQRALPDLFSGPATDDLDQSYRGHPSLPEDCHFNDRGLKEVGRRWADKIGLFLDAKLP